MCRSREFSNYTTKRLDMFKQIDFSEATGKTVRAVVQCGEDAILVSFNDETFSFIRAARSWEDASIETQSTFNPLEQRLDLVLELAFGDKAKAMHDAAKADEESRRKAKWSALREKRRQEYERLKAEFESDSSGLNEPNPS